MTGLKVPVCSPMSQASFSGTSSAGPSGGGVLKSTAPVSGSSVVPVLVSPASLVPVKEAWPVVGSAVVEVVAESEAVPSSVSVAEPVWPVVGVDVGAGSLVVARVSEVEVGLGGSELSSPQAATTAARPRSIDVARMAGTVPDARWTVNGARVRSGRGGGSTRRACSCGRWRYSWPRPHCG